MYAWCWEAILSAEGNPLSIPPGEYDRKVETQIDGGPHKRWIMWFNSMQREEPYLGLKYGK